MKSIFTLIKFHAKSRNFIPYSRRINRGEPTIVSPPYSPAAESHRFIFLRFVRIRKRSLFATFLSSFLFSLSLSSFFLSFLPTFDNTDRASSIESVRNKFRRVRRRRTLVSICQRAKRILSSLRCVQRGRPPRTLDV